MDSAATLAGACFAQTSSLVCAFVLNSLDRIERPAFQLADLLRCFLAATCLLRGGHRRMALGKTEQHPEVFLFALLLLRRECCVFARNLPVSYRHAFADLADNSRNAGCAKRGCSSCWQGLLSLVLSNPPRPGPFLARA